jgi:hypothetical protein
MTRTWFRSVAAALLLVVGLGACSDDSDGAKSEPVGGSVSTTTPGDAVAAVDVSGVQLVSVPNGQGVPQASATTSDAAEPLPATYREAEHLLSGTAAVYAGPVTGPVTEERAGHEYTTRVLVRAPKDAVDFSGSVWIEPFNTSGGAEADVVWSSLAPLIASRGDAWVGVTVRADQEKRLQEFDPVRYADLDLAQNAYSWDVLRQLGTLVKANDADSPLADVDVEHAYLGGYSQSAVDTATFATAFNESTRLADGAAVYDGYLIGARESNLSPLQSGDTIIPQFERAPLPPVDVPVMNVEPQTDVEGFAVEVPTALARQEGLAGADEIDTPTFTYVNVGGAKVRRADADADNDRYRLYEIPGAPHAGNGDSCDGTSTFPTRSFTRAAAAHLARWAEDDVAPPKAARIELATLDDVSVTANDEYGNARGGVRSPFVDAPLFRYEVHTGPGPFCILSGTETPLDAGLLERLYRDADGYMTAFTASLDETIEAGFLLELDRQPILELQRANANAVFAGG